MSKETLYDLRALLALYPYYQPARLLMLQNLYLLHDPCFNEELKRAAIYITDRRVIFRMIEAAHYQIKKPTAKHTTTDSKSADRTSDLIDSFLDSIPVDSEQEEKEKKEKRKPTPADATVDYVAYLMQTADADKQEEKDSTSRTVALIDGFMEEGGFQLPMLNEGEGSDSPSGRGNQENGDYSFTAENQQEALAKTGNEEQTESSSIYTETFAHIYIKQKKYDRALAIIEKLQKKQPTKSAYYTDQMRFLEKLIVNSMSNKQ